MWKHLSSYFENEKPFVDKEGFMPKDVYEYLTNFADDKTILNMLSVNKKFNDEQFFKRVMGRKYPLLLKYKGAERSNETYKEFFIRLVYYLSKLDEEFGIPYIAVPDFDPEGFYLGSLSRNGKINNALVFALEIRDLNAVKHIVERNKDSLNTALHIASTSGYLEFVKYLVSQGANSFSYAIEYAGKHVDVIDFLLDQMLDSEGEQMFDYVLESLTRQGELGNVKLAVEKLGDKLTPEDFTFAIASAEERGYADIVEYLEEYIQ